MLGHGRALLIESDRVRLRVHKKNSRPALQKSSPSSSSWRVRSDANAKGMKKLKGSEMRAWRSPAFLGQMDRLDSWTRWLLVC